MRNNIELKPGERIDELQRNGYGIIQSKNNFCFGMDAVLLSGFAKVKKGETAVDLGTGTGIIPILLEAKTGGKKFYGIEIQPEMAEMAGRSVKLNGLEEKIEILNADLCNIISVQANKDTAANEEVRGAGGDTEAGTYADSDIDRTERENTARLTALRGRVNVVTCNPPYMKDMHGLKNPEDAKAVARHEVKCTLYDVCAAASALLMSGGRFYMVHRPLRLPEIITELKRCRLEPKRIKPVYPFIDKEANMVLIEAVKDGAPECRFEKPIVVYKEVGKYTDEIYEIYGY